MTTVKLVFLSPLRKVQTGDRKVLSHFQVQNLGSHTETIYNFGLRAEGSLPLSALGNIVIRRCETGHEMTPTLEKFGNELDCSPPFSILPGDRVTFALSASIITGECGNTITVEPSVFVVNTETGYGEGGKLIPSQVEVVGKPTTMTIE